VAKHYLQLSKVLKKLLYDRRMNASELAREVELPTPTVHRLVTGKSTRPYESSLKPIADYFSIDVEQLLGEKPIPALNEPVEQNGKALGTSSIGHIPLIPWEQLQTGNNEVEHDKIPFVGAIGIGGFATVMPDTSMEPLIQRGCILIFDPLIVPADRSYVLVKLHETMAFTLRQLLIDADHKYLKPLNPDLSTFRMRLLDNNDSIIACLVETRHNFQHENTLKTS
jgi:SOS-response transcriptional repressor LexA